MVENEQSRIVPEAGRREQWAWATLDFANSGYTTVVLTAVFNAYFVGQVVSDPSLGTLVWTLTLSLSYISILLAAPWIGAYADAHAAKRRLLLVSTVLCGLATAGLALVGPGELLLAGLLLIVSNFAYASHQDLSAAFLRELAPPERLGRLSGLGWAWGYWGGLIALVLALVWVQAGAGLMGVETLSPQQQMGGAVLLTSALFLLSGLPALALLRERSQPTHENWRAGWSRLLSGWRQMSPEGCLRRFLVCVVVYQAGVVTVISLAAVYAQQQMGFTLVDTLLLVIVVNVTGSLGAAVFGLVQDRIGHKQMLSLTLVLWILMVILAAAPFGEVGFWVAANLAGLAMGASQSGARALVAELAPVEAQAEAFGYLGVAVHLAAVFGPPAYGLVVWLTDNQHQLALLVTGLYFVVGLVLLRRLPIR